ncbi:MAG: DUF2085 domain-containing protein, partial [Pyrinomonadaceae bacterium]
MNIKFGKPSPFTIRSEISQDQRLRVRKISFLLWSLVLIFFAFWNLAIICAPLAKINGFGETASLIYHFFSYVCHQIDARSFHIHDAPFAVCARCFGFYIGFLAGLVIYPFAFKIENQEPLNPIWLFLSVIPTGVDWTLGFLGIWENTHFSRSTTGALLGITCAV